MTLKFPESSGCIIAKTKIIKNVDVDHSVNFCFLFHSRSSQVPPDRQSFIVEGFATIAVYLCVKMRFTFVL
jgi:hypothetical protein